MRYSGIILGGLLAFVTTANAMPTEAQTKQAESQVMTLTEESRGALLAGKKTPVEVADSVMQLADAVQLADPSSTEATKLLLMKGAFNLYVSAGRYDSAIDALQRLKAAIADIPPANLANIIESALQGIPRRNAEDLYRLLDAYRGRSPVVSGDKIYYVNGVTGRDSYSGLSANAAKKTIQAAIDIAAVGGVIRVAAGTYPPISTANKPLTIIGEEGKHRTFIDGNGNSRCALLGSDTNECATVVAGFTLTNGCLFVSWCGDGGAGVKGGTLRDCRIVDCRINGGWNGYGGDGGGALGSRLENCEIFACKSLAGGGCIYSVADRCTVRDCYAHDDGGGAYGCTLSNCLIVRNFGYNVGGGACGSGLSGGVAYNCTVAYNRARTGGTINGGVLYNSIIYGNTPANVGAGYNRHESAGKLFSCVTDDPKFVNPDAGDYRLAPDSPCVNVGDNAFVNCGHDLDGNTRMVGGIVDLGCYECANPQTLPPKANTSASARNYIQDGLKGQWDGIENVGYGRHDDSSSTWVDLTGNGHNAKRWGESGKWRDNSFEFSRDGVGFFSTASGFQSTLGSSWTVEMYVKPTAAARDNYAGICGAHGGSPAIGVAFQTDTRSLYSFVWGRSRLALPTLCTIRDSEPWPTGEYLHIAMTVDNAKGEEKVYVNGVLKCSATFAPGISPSLTHPDFWIGRANPSPGRQFAGNIYAIRAYNRALSASEIAKNRGLDMVRFMESAVGGNK